MPKSEHYRITLKVHDNHDEKKKPREMAKTFSRVQLVELMADHFEKNFSDEREALYSKLFTQWDQEALPDIWSTYIDIDLSGFLDKHQMVWVKLTHWPHPNGKAEEAEFFFYRHTNDEPFKEGEFYEGRINTTDEDGWGRRTWINSGTIEEVSSLELHFRMDPEPLIGLAHLNALLFNKSEVNPLTMLLRSKDGPVKGAARQLLERLQEIQKETAEGFTKLLCGCK